MFQRKAWRTDPAHRPHVRPQVEELETRVVPYAVSGNAWPEPQLITISFVPDGTLLGYNQNGPIYSTLQNDFDNLFGSPAVWEKQILLAAQSWADATNINFAVVNDNGAELGSITGYNEQGDPNFGDIRIGGFQDTGAGYLAQAYQPPPGNDYSIAGDIWFNTSQTFNIGSAYNLYTVAAHEIGHALGMDHSADSSAIMAPYYPGNLTSLSADDKAGIESIYSDGQPRAYDAYNQKTHNSAFSSAAAFTINTGTLTAQLTNLDITTVGQNEYFKFVAPAGNVGTLQLSLQSAGLSLLSPRVWVYNSAETQIGYLSGANEYGTTLALNVNGIVAGKTYYIKVNGSESDPLGTGLYDLSVSVGSNAPPSVTLPDTTTPNGNPITQQGSMAEAIGDYYEISSGQHKIAAPVAPPTPTAVIGILERAPETPTVKRSATAHKEEAATKTSATTKSATASSSEEETDEVVPAVIPLAK